MTTSIAAVDPVEARSRGTRPAARGPRARPARPRCGSRRPRASAPRPGTPRPARGCAGTPAATRAARLADRRVRHRPVDREPEPAPQLLELLLVLDHEPLAELDEVRPRDRDRAASPGFSGGSNVGVVRQRRIAAHAEVVLDPPLGRQAVVVPPHRVEDLAPAHALVAGDRVGVRVREHVPDVQRPADRRRRRVDRVDLVARLRSGRSGRCPSPPTRADHFVLEPVEARLLRARPSAAVYERSALVRPGRRPSAGSVRRALRRCGGPRRR